MEIEKLIHDAFHLRRSIDALRNGEKKQRLVRKYVQIIWKIQDYQPGK